MGESQSTALRTYLSGVDQEALSCSSKEDLSALFQRRARLSMNPMLHFNEDLQTAIFSLSETSYEYRDLFRLRDLYLTAQLRAYIKRFPNADPSLLES